MFHYSHDRKKGVIAYVPTGRPWNYARELRMFGFRTNIPSELIINGETTFLNMLCADLDVQTRERLEGKILHIKQYLQEISLLADFPLDRVAEEMYQLLTYLSKLIDSTFYPLIPAQTSSAVLLTQAIVDSGESLDDQLLSIYMIQLQLRLRFLEPFLTSTLDACSWLRERDPSLWLEVIRWFNEMATGARARDKNTTMIPLRRYLFKTIRHKLHHDPAMEEYKSLYDSTEFSYAETVNRPEDYRHFHIALILTLRSMLSWDLMKPNLTKADIPYEDAIQAACVAAARTKSIV